MQFRSSTRYCKPHYQKCKRATVLVRREGAFLGAKSGNLPFITHPCISRENEIIRSHINPSKIHTVAVTVIVKVRLSSSLSSWSSLSSLFRLYYISKYVNRSARRSREIPPLLFQHNHWKKRKKSLLLHHQKDNTYGKTITTLAHSRTLSYSSCARQG